MAKFKSKVAKQEPPPEEEIKEKAKDSNTDEKKAEPVGNVEKKSDL